MNWATEAILNIISDFLQDIIDAITGFIESFYADAENMVQDQVICRAATGVSGIIIFLTILFVSKNLFTTYIAQTDGDADADPLQMIIKAAQVLAITGISAVLTDKFLSYSRHFSAFLMETVKVDANGYDTAISSLLAICNITSPTGAVATSILVVMIIVFLVRGAIRGAELCLMKILLPVFALDLLTVSHERWNSFVTSYLITLFGYSLQLLCFRMSLTKLINAFDISSVLLVIGFMYMAIKAPKWLEKFAYSSGLSHTATAGARSMVYMMPKIMSR